MEEKKKTTLIGLILIILLLGSTLAYAIIQSISPGKIKDNIVDFELTREQENELIQNRKTILKFYYSLDCNSCMEQKSFLEELVKSEGYKNQLFLERILANVTEPSLTIISAYGGKFLPNATKDEILDVLCDLMVSPPEECVLKKV
jgi:thiol-disulfide isomerase/thioredoxin